MERETMIHGNVEECVRILRQLQTNEEVIEKQQQTKIRDQLRMENMYKWASRAGVTSDDTDKLKIIHVSGTKGKGSTCAYCESILRHHGYRTGFFSSPHLVDVRERIRINGQPLSKEKFVSYFWEIYNKLEDTKAEADDGGSMPGFFSFLTVMTFHVFRKEQTDVAIIEVGVGGQYDRTNIIRKPIVCGVTSLGLDHTKDLGNTIEDIAWQKGGILKHGAAAFTAPQHIDAIRVLHDRAKKIGCSLEVVPQWDVYQVQGKRLKLGLAGDIQKINASLALQLTNTWMKSQVNDMYCSPIYNMNDDRDVKVADSFPLTPTIIKGLSECTWLGRNQKVKRDHMTYYIDGAHTVESIETHEARSNIKAAVIQELAFLQCVAWFQKHSKRDATDISGKVVKILVFSTSGDRNSTHLQVPLTKCGFDAVVFCPVISHRGGSNPDMSMTMTDMSYTKESELARCHKNMDNWTKLIQEAGKNNADKCGHITKESDHIESEVSADYTGHGCSSPQIGNGVSENHIGNRGSADLQPSITGKSQRCHCDGRIVQLPSIYDSLLWASHQKDPNLKHSFDLPPQINGVDHVHVLVTGSLYLVGGALGILCNNI